MDINDPNACVYRALTAAFRYSNVTVPEFPKGLDWLDNFRAYTKALGLEVTDSGYITTGWRPVIAVYEPPLNKVSHAVFVSDVAPITRYPTSLIIAGWETFDGSKISTAGRKPYGLAHELLYVCNEAW